MGQGCDRDARSTAGQGLRPGATGATLEASDVILIEGMGKKTLLLSSESGAAIWKFLGI
jgi:hypothetical protein